MGGAIPVHPVRSRLSGAACQGTLLRWRGQNGDFLDGFPLPGQCSGQQCDFLDRKLPSPRTEMRLAVHLPGALYFTVQHDGENWSRKSRICPACPSGGTVRSRKSRICPVGPKLHLRTFRTAGLFKAPSPNVRMQGFCRFHCILEDVCNQGGISVCLRHNSNF